MESTKNWRNSVTLTRRPTTNSLISLNRETCFYRERQTWTRPKMYESVSIGSERIVLTLVVNRPSTSWLISSIKKRTKPSKELSRWWPKTSRRCSRSWFLEDKLLWLWSSGRRAPKTNHLNQRQARSANTRQSELWSLSPRGTPMRLKSQDPSSCSLEVRSPSLR